MANKRILIRRDTTANWVSVNPILGLAEYAYDITVKDFKIGDGVNAWNDLYYYGANITSGSTETPGGNDTSIQFNEGDSFGGDAEFLYDYTNTNVITPNLYVNKRLTLNYDTITSSNNITLTNGNLFLIDGSTTLYRIEKTNWTNGSEITLQFNANNTVQNNASISGDYVPIIFKNGQNKDVVNTEIVKLIFINDIWYETNSSDSFGYTTYNDGFDVDATVISNKYIDLTHTPTTNEHLLVTLNGLMLDEISDFTIATNRITFDASLTLTINDKLIIKYKY